MAINLSEQSPSSVKDEFADFSPPVKEFKWGFASLPEHLGEVVTIAGDVGLGKTFMALNFFPDMKDDTVFIDTEPTNTTIATLKRNNHEQYWKASTWPEIKSLTNVFLEGMKLKGKKGVLVIDSGSVIVPWVSENYKKTKNVKVIPRFDYEDLWDEIREWMMDIVHRGGHHLILTLYLRRNYTKDEILADGRQIYGSWDGTWYPHEWKDLLSFSDFAFQLERGLLKGTKRVFEGTVFCFVRKTRPLNAGWQKYLLPPLNRIEVEKQLTTPFNGDKMDLLASIYANANAAFKLEADIMYRGDEWEKKKAHAQGKEWVPPPQGEQAVLGNIKF